MPLTPEEKTAAKERLKGEVQSLITNLSGASLASANETAYQIKVRDIMKQFEANCANILNKL